jgi:DNA-binding ferritin-like protein (Dps family)
MIWPRVSLATLRPLTVYQKVCISSYTVIFHLLMQSHLNLPFSTVTRLTMTEEKHRREVEAMNQLVSLLPGDFSLNATNLRALFDEYEQGTSNEAILVKDVDKYELLVQAVEYERDAVQQGEELKESKDLSSFFGAREFIKTDMVRKWADDVMAERGRIWMEAERKKINRSVTGNGLNGSE